MTNRQLHRLKKQWLAEGYRMGERRAKRAMLNEGTVGTAAGIGAAAGGLAGSIAGPVGTAIGAGLGAASGAAVGAGAAVAMAPFKVAKWALGKLLGSLTEGQKTLGNNVTAILMKTGDQFSNAIAKSSNKKLASAQAYSKVLNKALSMCNQETIKDISENGIGGIAKQIDKAFDSIEGYESPSSSEVKQMINSFLSGSAGQADVE